MGEIAEMMLDGTLDSVTGEYLGEPCGYPRSMTDGTYWPDRNKLQKRARQSLRDLCRDKLGMAEPERVDKVVWLFLKAIGLARIPKKHAQYEMVFLHHKADFKQFLNDIKNGSYDGI